MTPTLAVVGHPNKGKSSIVATLAENTQVRVGDIPGTTRRADHFQLHVGGETLYDLVDTPGFQRAGQVYNWLTEHATDASARGEWVRRFVATHREAEHFADECALLTPIIEGAGILYVVDGSVPYGSEYELEMEILRWTGRPRMALINRIGEADYAQAWRQGLGQYFSIVREFNAHKASFEQRIDLLRAFGEIEESWRKPMGRACQVLREQRHRQLAESAASIADLLTYVLRAKSEQPIGAAESISPSQTEALQDALSDKIRSAESRARRAVQKYYRHDSTRLNETELHLLNAELFTEQSWELFGLSRTQLIASGGVSGILAGGALDALVGGSSLFAGTLIGGAIGSLTAWLGGGELAKMKVAGTPMGGNVARVGPIRNPNFPWVILGRACLHHTLISEHNHALRDVLVSQFGDSEGFFKFLNRDTRRALDREFARLRHGRDAQQTLQQHITDVLREHGDSLHPPDS